MNKNTGFIMLTPELLHTENLTSTDKLVLGLNRTMQPYFASNDYAADYLGMTVSTVRKSITKLRKLGLWKETTGYSSSRAAATRVVQAATRVSDAATRVADKKSFSPLKTGSGLESRLESNKKEGLESAAGAAALCDSPQTSFKNLEKGNSVSLKSQEIKISAPTGSEAPIEDRHPSVAPTVQPPPPTHAPPLTRPASTHKSSMRSFIEEISAKREANFQAIINGKPPPYSVRQVMG